MPAIVAATIAAFPAHPALAQGTAIPEPTGTTLFGLGVAGLVIGRYAAKRKPRD